MPPALTAANSRAVKPSIPEESEWTVGPAPYFAGGPQHKDEKYGTLVASGTIPHHPEWPENTIRAMWDIANHHESRLQRQMRTYLAALEGSIYANSARVAAVRYEVHYSTRYKQYTIGFFADYRYQEEDVSRYDSGRGADGGADYRTGEVEGEVGNGGDGGQPAGQVDVEEESDSEDGELSGSHDGHWHHGAVNTWWKSGPAEDDGCSDIIAETEAGWVRMRLDFTSGFSELSTSVIREVLVVLPRNFRVQRWRD